MWDALFLVLWRLKVVYNSIIRSHSKLVLLFALFVENKFTENEELRILKEPECIFCSEFCM